MSLLRSRSSGGCVICDEKSAIKLIEVFLFVRNPFPLCCFQIFHLVVVF